MKSELAFQMNKLQHQRDVCDNCRKTKEEKSKILYTLFFTQDLCRNISFNCQMHDNKEKFKVHI